MEKKVKIKSGDYLIIREASKEDAQLIIDYLNQVGGESDNLLFGENDCRISVKEEERIIENFNRFNNQILCLAYLEDELVSVSKLSSSERERIAHISNFAISVKKEFWNQGIGTAVIDYLADYAKETGVIKTINLMVNVNNEPGIKLYKKMGFEEVGIFKDYFFINGEYIDSIIMNRYLM